MESPIKLSICCTTYNHEPYVRQALEGFVMQKTNFPFEVIVHDDASTDKTADIIREYQQKYPDIIKPILQEVNQCSQGVAMMKDILWPRLRGQYVALNEGDDYWTDEYKLQKQVDFLDAHPDFSICFHPVRVTWEDHSEPDHIWPSPELRFNKDVLTMEDLLKHNFIQTNSVVYRKDKALELWPKRPVLTGDYFLHLIHANQGKIGFLPDVMSVYRKHSGGIWYGALQSDAWFRRCGYLFTRFYRDVEKAFKTDQYEQIVDLSAKVLPTLLRLREWKSLMALGEELDDIWEKLFTDVRLCSQDEFKRREDEFKRREDEFSHREEELRMRLADCEQCLRVEQNEHDRHARKLRRKLRRLRRWLWSVCGLAILLVSALVLILISA